MADPRSGALTFARFAYPPNVLGYCGPDAAGQLLDQVAAGVDDRGLRALLRGFDGAWPYLELIAGAAGIADPLDERVVEAYWIGNELLDRVPMSAFGDSMTTRFGPRLSRPAWAALAESIPAGAVPHHSQHVFGVYPWVGLLRGGRVDEPLHVLDRCRIRWGQVVAAAPTDRALPRPRAGRPRTILDEGPTARVPRDASLFDPGPSDLGLHDPGLSDLSLHDPALSDPGLGDRILVRSRPLTWDGHRLGLGPPRLESARLRSDGLTLVEDPAPGDWVALHWDWVCERLDARRLAALRAWSARTLALVNALPHAAPAAVLT